MSDRQLTINLEESRNIVKMLQVKVNHLERAISAGYQTMAAAREELARLRDENVNLILQIGLVVEESDE